MASFVFAKAASNLVGQSSLNNPIYYFNHTVKKAGPPVVACRSVFAKASTDKACCVRHSLRRRRKGPDKLPYFALLCN